MTRRTTSPRLYRGEWLHTIEHHYRCGQTIGGLIGKLHDEIEDGQSDSVDGPTRVFKDAIVNALMFGGSPQRAARNNGLSMVLYARIARYAPIVVHAAAGSQAVCAIDPGSTRFSLLYCEVLAQHATQKLQKRGSGNRQTTLSTCPVGSRERTANAAHCESLAELGSLACQRLA